MKFSNPAIIINGRRTNYYTHYVIIRKTPPSPTKYRLSHIWRHCQDRRLVTRNPDPTIRESFPSRTLNTAHSCPGSPPETWWTAGRSESASAGHTGTTHAHTDEHVDNIMLPPSIPWTAGGTKIFCHSLSILSRAESIVAQQQRQYAVNFLSEVGRRLTSLSGDSRETSCASQC